MQAEVAARMKIVVFYAIWATICAAVSGIAMAFIHTAFFSHHVGRSGMLETWVGGVILGLAIAAGQGAVTLVTGSVLARMGRVLQATVLLGLLVGLFDFVMYFVQTAIPATELGWIPDLVILVIATVAITVWGAKRPGGTPS
jgi:hypothetical protein